MDWKLELVPIPVADVDRAKAFYADQVGFTVDHDHNINDELRIVQLTPPGSACSILLSKGVIDTKPAPIALDPKPGQGALHKLDAARGHYLECVKFAKDLDGELDFIRLAFREIAGERALN